MLRAFRGIALLVVASPLLVACVDDASTGPVLRRDARATNTDDSQDEVASAELVPIPADDDVDADEQLARLTNEGSVAVAEEMSPGLFEGDIMFEEADDSALRTVAGSPTAAKLWPGGVMVYTISARLKNKQRVTDAIKHWESRTGIRFKQRTNEAAYVEFVAGGGCSSFIGRIGRRQPIILADGCTAGVTIHEIGHALGLWHEQSRSDRDRYVKVLLQNVQKGMESNFTKTTFKSNGSYDLGSIMHYGSTYFSANGKPTLTTLGGKVIAANRGALSKGDIEGIQAIYAKEVLPAPKPQPADATTTANLNLRAGPSTDFAILDTMPAGAKVTRTGKSQGGFDSVTYEGKDGWAYAAYLD